VEDRSVLRPILGICEPDLERELLRKGVDHRATGCARCADCGRVPLVGERVHRYAHGVIACELCRQSRRARPEVSELVHHAERGLSVRVLDLRSAA
jgi:hypothetical protein